MHKKSYIPPNRSNPFSLLPNTTESDSNDDAEGTGTSDNNSNKNVVDKNIVDNNVVNKNVDDKDGVDFKVYYSKKNENRDGGSSGYGGGYGDSGHNGRGGWRAKGNGSSDYGNSGGWRDKNTFAKDTFGGDGGDGDSGGWRGKNTFAKGTFGGGGSRTKGTFGGIGRYDNNFKRTSDSQNINNVEPLQYVFSDVPDNIGDIVMNNNYRVLAHHNADSNWNFDSYHHVSTLKKWEDVPKLFNTLNETKYSSKITDFDFFIMKNEISPLWEDEENRCGSICSIKIDTLKDGYNILKTLFVHICNNTLMNITKNNVPNWNIINGVSFSCKKVENVSSVIEQDYSMIKIWFKTNYTQFENIDKYFNDDINAMLKKYSIKVRAIKPEY
jgi:hypothetical protein